MTRPPVFPRVSQTRYVSYDNLVHVMLDNSQLITGFLVEHHSTDVYNTSQEVFAWLGNPYLHQVMSIMSHSLEGFSLAYMKEMSTIQDLDSYPVSFKRWVTYLNNLYKKPNCLAKFFGMFFPQQADKLCCSSLFS